MLNIFTDDNTDSLYRFLFLIAALYLSIPANAQELEAGHFYISGTVLDSLSKEGIAGLTVGNLTLKITAVTDQDGRFQLEAALGNRLQVSGTGHQSRFITIYAQPLSPLSIILSRRSTTLNEVVVSRRRVGYTADSSARHATYARVLARRREGSVMSPVSFIAEKISRKSRRMFRFQKDFAQMEEERFIDSRYTPQLTASQTQLSGDTIAYFMNANPMPEDLARTGSDMELKQWIRWSYKNWMAKGRPVPLITADSTLQR